MVPSMSPSAATLYVSVLMAMLTVSTAQQRFQFCGGPGLIHAVIRVCSRSLPDELVLPPTERPSTTTTGQTAFTSITSSRFFTARRTTVQSAVLLSHVVRLSVCKVGGS